ncbi:MAG TPA: NADH-quinone oxidoreductase subunit NuoG [Candidatus Acidoferrales bacterium]|nr:NADH-quinone oxidoreductase subunit NuoG [Candidatus Acidoferrales bacterium]
MAETQTQTISFTLNGQKLTVPKGTLVIEAAKRAGIEIPSFCYYPGLALQAACRMCLVEVEKQKKMATACTLVAEDGMVVLADTPAVHKARKDMLEFVLTNHPLDCPVCDKGGECELQDMTFTYGIDYSRYTEEKLHYPEEKWSPIVFYDAPRCILCYRCVRVCDEGMDVKALGVASRGVTSVIIPNQGPELACEECGMCIDICPVGALTSGTYRYQTRPWEMKYFGTACAHCSNGCKTTLSVRNNEILRANNRDHGGINGEFLCPKGRFGHDFTANAERIRQPLVRKGGAFQPASWEDAIEEIVRRLKQAHDAHGPSAIGVIGSNHTTNEENYLLNRFARATLGTNNIDHHRTADYAGLAAALGAKAEAAMATMADIDKPGAILLIGNDATQQNPLVAWQIRSAVRHHNAALYIIDGRPLKLHRQAKQLVQVPVGSEGRAASWLATGQGQFDGSVAAELGKLKDALAKEKDVVILFGAGVNGAAVRDLVKFGSSLQGQTRYMALGDYANSRGAADMGILPDHLPGYSAISDGNERARFGKLWGKEIPSSKGMNARQMMQAALDGKLKALYVVGANPVKTFGIKAPEKFAGVDLLVVQDMFMTETAQRADVILPAASTYEKDGTLTNTAGEIQMVWRAVDAQGPRSDFDLLRILIHQLAQLGLGAAMKHRTPEAVLEEIRQNVRGYDVPAAGLLTGGIEKVSAAPANADGAAEAGADLIFSSQDFLFSSGTLGRYCSKLNSCKEAKEKPWTSSPSIQSWWYR